MKFKVRDGFVCKVVTQVDLGDGRMQAQESTSYGGQLVDLSPEQANEHAHKLEPMGKDAVAFLDEKAPPLSSADSLGISPQMAALAEAMATAMVAKIMAAQKPAVPAA